jgi:hypothetical protein
VRDVDAAAGNVGSVAPLGLLIAPQAIAALDTGDAAAHLARAGIAPRLPHRRRRQDNQHEQCAYRQSGHGCSYSFVFARFFRKTGAHFS